MPTRFIHVSASTGTGKSTLMDYVGQYCVDNKIPLLPAAGSPVGLVDSDEFAFLPYPKAYTKPAIEKWHAAKKIAIQQELQRFPAETKLALIFGVIYTPVLAGSSEGIFDFAPWVDERWYYDVPLADYMLRYYRREICRFMQPGFDRLNFTEGIFDSKNLISIHTEDRVQFISCGYTPFTEEQLKTRLIDEVRRVAVSRPY